ncbi:MAG: carbohydrate kinase [Hyphomicrobiales bacterium]|nr:carbohydrate kinase [Hyphomicrobiales bacterium]
MIVRIGPTRSLTVFGAANVDHISATETAPIMGASNPGAARTAPGGVGFNLATILARLGHEVRLVTRVGRDPGGTMAITAAKAAGIDVTHISASDTAATASYLAALDHRGNLIVGIAGMSVYEEVTPSVLSGAVDAAPTGDVWVIDTNLPADTLGFLVKKAEAGKHPVVALAVSPAKALKLTPILPVLSLVFANRKEAMAILGRSDPRTTDSAATLAATLSRRGPDAVVTDAGAPLAVATAQSVRSFAPLPARIRSVNGAGDSLAAGTVHAVANGANLFEAIFPGLAAAAVTMEHEATVPTNLDSKAIAARLASIHRKPPS